MHLLNTVFSRFDSIIAERGCQRIKTIGDGYLATAGLPIPKHDHAEALALAAVEMIEPQTVYLNGPQGGAEVVEVHFRIGLHAGPVTAGLVGGSLTQYDIYGDTVNTASRMESHGKVDTVLCSAAFAALVEHCRDIYIEDEGVINLKGIGPMPTARLSKKMRQGPSGVV
jgi:class 3 adenylate cyclase